MPFVNGALTPLIAGLQGGADIYGLLNDITASDLDYNLNTSAKDAPDADALAAVYRLNVGPIKINSADYSTDYTNYDMVLFINLTNNVLDMPTLGINQSATNLLTGGFSTDTRFGGTGVASTLSKINPGKIWATLVPSNVGNITVNAAIANAVPNTTTTITNQTLINNQVAYIRATRPNLTTTPNLSGLQSITVSDDGKQIYGVSAVDNALVAINASDLSQRQLFKDNLDGVNGLASASDTAISKDGKNVYVASPVDNRLSVFSRNVTTGNLSFVTTVGSIPFNSVTVSNDGTRVYGSSSNSIVTYTRNTSTGGLTQTASTVNLNGINTLNNLTLSQDGSVLYAASRIQDTLLVIRASNLSVVQTLSGTGLGLDGASGITSSSDNTFVYVTGQDGNTLSVFKRDLATNQLTLVEKQENGVAGVRGLVGANDVTITSDGKYVLATANTSDAISVFLRNSTTGKLQFVQVLRNNIGGTTGLKAPSSIFTLNNKTYASSLGQTGFSGGVVVFDNNTTLPAPSNLISTFDGIEGLSITTASGDDTIKLQNAPNSQVATTTINTNGGNDTVVLDDLSVTTRVNLGNGDDQALLRSTRANTNLIVNGDANNDAIAIEQAGNASRTEVFGGDGADMNGTKKSRNTCGLSSLQLVS